MDNTNDTGGFHYESLEEGKPPRKSKKWLIAVVIAAVLLLAAGGTVFALNPTLFKSKNEIVTNALAGLLKKDKNSPLQTIFGSDDLNQMAKNNVEQGMVLQLENLFSLFMQTGLEGSKISMNTFADRENGRASLTAGLELGEAGGGLDLYIDQGQAMMGMPRLTDQIFTVDYSKSLVTQAEESAVDSIFDKEELEVLEASLNIISKNLVNNSDDPDFSDIVERYYKTSSAKKNLEKSYQITEIGKQKFTYKGKNVNCRGYEVVVPKEAFITFLRETSDFFLKDEDLQKLLYGYSESSMIISYVSDGLSMEAAMEQMSKDRDLFWANMYNMVSEAISNLEKDLDRLEFTIYVNGKGQAAYLNTEMIMINGKSISLELTIEGGTTQLQNYNGTFMIGSPRDGISAEITKTGSYKKGLWEAALDLSLTASDNMLEGLEISYEGSYVKGTKEYDISLSLRQSGTMNSFGLVSNGVFTELKKGKAMAVDIESLGITVMGMKIIDFSGSYYIRPLIDQIKAPEGPMLDIITATEKEWEDAGNEIIKNMEAIVEEVENMIK